MKIDKDNIKKLIEENLLKYVGTRTDTNSKEERNVEKFFEEWFEKVEYFKIIQINVDYLIYQMIT